VNVRPFVEADIPAVAALASETIPELPLTETELRTWFTNPAADSTFVVVEDDEGRLSAYADVLDLEGERRRLWLDLRARPDATAEAAVDWAEGIARERGLPALNATAIAGSGLADLFGGRGYRQIRSSFRMLIELEAPPPQPEWPAGIVTRPLEPGEERAVYEAMEEAFADAWEHPEVPSEAWTHIMVEAEDFDPALWHVARDGAEVAGAAVCRYAPGRPGVGWVRQLGVRSPWRRRGLGTALLLVSFRTFWERGAHAVGLGVDGENTTGAVALYERAGMHVEHRIDQLEREVS